MTDPDGSPRPPAEPTDLFIAYRAEPTRQLRNRIVEQHLGLAHHIARRFDNKGLAFDDLRQVALLALVKAVERFDPGREVAFSTFAGRTIEGELKRHFRDTSWGLRVPRSVKELHLQVRRAIDELGQTSGHSPSVAEVAAHLEIHKDAVVEALGASAAYTPGSLDTPVTDDDQSGDRQGFLGADDPRLGDADDRLLVETLLARLPEREREIVRLRFYEHLSQTEIAEQMGISQMHVSRLLQRSFALMRGGT